MERGIVTACSNFKSSKLQQSPPSKNWDIKMGYGHCFPIQLPSRHFLRWCFDLHQSCSEQGYWCAMENQECKIITLKGVVPHTSFCWVLREANGVANSLAKCSVKSRFVSSFDLCNCPPCVSNILRVEES